ncbi:MAG: hypothetical protein ACRDG3_12305, partial [Tepidiformaceae bacterium]
NAISRLYMNAVYLRLISASLRGAEEIEPGQRQRWCEDSPLVAAAEARWPFFGHAARVRIEAVGAGCTDAMRHAFARA